MADANDHTFNPRPREEGDPYFRRRKSSVIRLSIHALVKRATGYDILVILHGAFQSTPS